LMPSSIAIRSSSSIWALETQKASPHGMSHRARVWVCVSESVQPISRSRCATAGYRQRLRLDTARIRLRQSRFEGCAPFRWRLAPGSR
jgi:hypothetical protein